MINISGFFQKFLNLEKDKNTKIILILDAIKQETGLELSAKMLEIKGDFIKLNCKPYIFNV